MQPKRRGVLALAIVGLLSISGMAMAQTEDDTETENDTVFNFGYIEEDQFLMWNVSSIDYEVDDGSDSTDELSYEFLVEHCSLDIIDGEEAEFTYTVDGDGNITLETEEGTFELPDVCEELVGGEVTGPAGQVNHGMFMKLFNSLYEGENRGCLVRHLAQSDLGKGDQQIKVEEADEADEATDSDEDPTFSFTTVETDCQQGPDGDTEDSDDGKGPPDFVKQKFEDGGPGRSGNGHGPPWKNN